MASYQFNPINILDTTTATSLTDGGSLTLGGGIAIGKDTYIGGNVIISGTTTAFSDNILLVNKDPISSSDMGIIFQRYSQDVQNNKNYAGIVYSEQNDSFNLGYLTSDAGRNYVTVDSLAPLNVKDITTGNINMSGDIYKNGVIYNPGSQWTNSNLDIYYTTGKVMTADMTNTNISATNIRLTNDLYVGGTLYTVNVTTTNVHDINISSGTINVSGISNLANVTATNVSTSTINASGISNLANVAATNMTLSTLIATTSVSSGLLSATNILGTNISAGILSGTTISGTTISGANLSLSSNLNIVGTITSGALRTSNIALNGNLIATGDITAFGSLSDIRLKTNIINIDNNVALTSIRLLCPVTFDWKDDIFNESKRGTIDVGFIAQEVEKVVPRAVAEYQEINSGVVYKNIKHERLIPYLVGAIQKIDLELQQEKRIIQQQKRTIENLESRISSLECYFETFPG